MRDEHKAEVEKVLGELEVLDKPRIEVLNKVDLLSEEERAALATARPAERSRFRRRSTSGLEALMERLDEELVQDPILEQRLQIPQSEGDVLAALEAGAVIREREYEGNLVRMTVTGPASLLGRYRRFRHADEGIRSAERANRMMESGGYLRSPGSPTLIRVEVVFSLYAGIRSGQARTGDFCEPPARLVYVGSETGNRHAEVSVFRHLTLIFCVC